MASQPQHTAAERSMTLDDILRILKQTRLFAGLSQQQIAGFAGSLEGVSFEAGDELLQKGDETFGLNIILHGSVEVVLPGSGNVAEVKLGVLRTGDFFCEYAIFDDQPASASVRALRSGDLIRFPKEAFRAVLQDNPLLASAIYYNLLHVLVERLRLTGQDFEVLMSGNA